MPALSTIGLFVLAALGLLVIPGPAVLYVTTRSAAQGRRAGLASVLGIELASLTHAVAAALGLSALLMTSALAFNVVKYLGAAYLCYLGLRILLKRQAAPPSATPSTQSYARLCGQGFLVNLLNPKTALFFYAFLPQFVVAGRGTVTAQILLFGLLFVVLASFTDSLYAMLGSTLGRWLLTHARARRGQHYVTAGIYIALGMSAAVTGSKRA